MHMDICKCTSVISTAIFRKGRPNNCGEIVLNVDKGLNINYLTKKKKTTFLVASNFIVGSVKTCQKAEGTLLVSRAERAS